MAASLRVLRAGPITTLQDHGRFGMLRHGISASGPMDSGAYDLACRGGQGGIEFTSSGIDLSVTTGTCLAGFDGGQFIVRHNGEILDWPGSASLSAGDTLSITPGSAGNYGYVRFGCDITAQPLMGSIATSSRVKLGGLQGRSLEAGDTIVLGAPGTGPIRSASRPGPVGPIRFIWGLHAQVFEPAVRDAFVHARFVVSASMDRMGVRLLDQVGVFAGAANLSLPSDAIVPGDIQIMGDGTPVVLMRDHQPTGGYPRIATIISAELDRFAQLRAGTVVAFQPVTLEHAHSLLQSTKQ